MKVNEGIQALVFILSIVLTGIGIYTAVNGSIPGALCLLAGWLGILFHVYIPKKDKELK